MDVRDVISRGPFVQQIDLAPAKAQICGKARDKQALVSIVLWKARQTSRFAIKYRQIKNSHDPNFSISIRVCTRVRWNKARKRRYTDLGSAKSSSPYWYSPLINRDKYLSAPWNSPRGFVSFRLVPSQQSMVELPLHFRQGKSYINNIFLDFEVGRLHCDGAQW